MMHSNKGNVKTKQKRQQRDLIQPAGHKGQPQPDQIKPEGRI